MGEAFRAETVIERPLETVWNALTDWERADRWMTGVEKISADGDDLHHMTLTFVARGKERPAELVHVQPHHSVTVRSVQGDVRADYRYEVLAVGPSSTRVRLMARCAVTGWARVGAPLLRLAMRRADGDQLEVLKQVVEEETV